MDNLVGAIDVFSDRLDLCEMGLEGVTPSANQRPGQHPWKLRRLDLYDAFNCVQSSRCIITQPSPGIDADLRNTLTFIVSKLFDTRGWMSLRSGHAKPPRSDR